MTKGSTSFFRAALGLLALHAEPGSGLLAEPGSGGARGGDGRKHTKHYAADDNTKVRRRMAKQSRRINRRK
jgi:hypothetical protein